MSEPFHPEVRIGHAHLRVGDLERATAFYRDVLGFDVIAYGPDVGMSGMEFLSAGGYHHHIALNTRDSADGTPPLEGHTGLHHIAILYPNRRELAGKVGFLLGLRSEAAPVVRYQPSSYLLRAHPSQRRRHLPDRRTHQRGGFGGGGSEEALGRPGLPK